MSETHDERPGLLGPEPEPGAEPGTAAAAAEGAAATSARRRRRGTRGGRGRRRRAAGSAPVVVAGLGGAGDLGAGDLGAGMADAAVVTAVAGAGEPEELPDPPLEGRPSPEAALRATVRPEEAAAAVAVPAGEVLPAGVKPKIGDTRPAPPPAPGQQRARRRRRGRARDAGLQPVEPVIGPEEAGAPVDAAALERRRGRERKGRPVGRYLMCVHVRPHATQVAVLEGRALIEHYVSRPQDDVYQIAGNIYLGRVQNVLPGMEAAFVDIGTPKNAVLYKGDVQYDPEDVEEAGQVRIEQVLRPGQTILCQVTKNPIGAKGARLTQEISLPGRFVVLIPNSATYGISKRLADEERRRLRRILDEIRPAGHGLIVRTAAEGATAEELRRDVTRLVDLWDQIDALAKRSKAPALVYREPNLAVRVIREEFNRDYRGVIIDDRALYEEVRAYVEAVNPELADRVEYYDTAAEPLPLFERYHVHEQLHKALDRKVWLPSGGSLVIERTEALTVIDVNTGKNVGSSNLEETVYRNNLEAAEEVARQLRLRDIGGIIVIDFIDMEVKKNRDDVIRAFRAALARDKTKTQVFDISELGLVQMTRKRVSEGLVEAFSGTCPTCNGRGIIIDESLL